MKRERIPLETSCSELSCRTSPPRSDASARKTALPFFLPLPPFLPVRIPRQDAQSYVLCVYACGHGHPKSMTMLNHFWGNADNVWFPGIRVSRWPSRLHPRPSTQDKKGFKGPGRDGKVPSSMSTGTAVDPSIMHHDVLISSRCIQAHKRIALPSVLRQR